MAGTALPMSLDALAGPIQGSFEVAGDQPIGIGRAAASQICLLNEGVSRRHATLVPQRGAWHIIDHASTGGTFLNGVRMSPARATPLGPGDLLKIGPCTFRVGAEGARTGPMATLVDRPGSAERVERGNATHLRPDRRLRLLSDALARLTRAADETELARVALEAAVTGSGYRWGAILRPCRESGSSGEAQVVATFPDPMPRPGQQAAAPTFSRSLVRQAAGGELVVLTQEQAPDYGQSIAEMRIHSAMCAPVHLGEAVEGFLYLDSRGESVAVASDAAGFCDAVAKAYGLAVANLKRMDLQRRHGRLQVDLDAAREAQQLLQPPMQAEVAFLSYAVRTVPGQFVAGDLFNLIPLDGGSVAVCLGDVAGHGVASAMVMSALQAHLHAVLEATGDALAAVDAVNRYLVDRSAAGRFASLWVGVLSPTGRLDYVDAGHGHWLVQRRGEAAVRAVGQAGVPVGIALDVAYPRESLQFSPGDRLILYSDGIVEQRGPDGEQFGRERVVGSIAGAAGAAPVDVVEAMFSRVIAHAGMPGFDDDTSAAVIEFRG